MISPSGQRQHRRRDAHLADQLRRRANDRRSARTADPHRRRAAVYSATSAPVSDSTDIPTAYALVNGRRAVYILVTKRADASTLERRQRGQGRSGRFQALVPDDITVSFEFDQSPNVTRSLQAVLIERRCSGAPDRPDGARVPARLAQRPRSSCSHPVRAARRRSSRSVAAGQTINLMTLGGWRAGRRHPRR